jgi:hypothetical protein
MCAGWHCGYLEAGNKRGGTVVKPREGILSDEIKKESFGQAVLKNTTNFVYFFRKQKPWALEKRGRPNMSRLQQQQRKGN